MARNEERQQTLYGRHDPRLDGEKLESQKLRSPFKYVAGVYGSMRVHGWQTPGLRVPIGREGTGAQPYYRIEQDGPDGSEKILVVEP